MISRSLLVYFLVFAHFCVFADTTPVLLKKGWNALIKDQDDAAYTYFHSAYVSATAENNTELRAEALLDLGICTYGANQVEGLNYAFRAMALYRKLEKSDSETGRNGQSRCLQLISTIYSRQGNYRKAIQCSREALSGLSANDTSGVRGLMYNSIGSCYHKLNRLDSSVVYYRLGLNDHERSRNSIYLPNSLLNMAEVELDNGNFTASKRYFDRSLALSKQQQNKQGIISAMLGIGSWYLKAENNPGEAASYYKKAQEMAQGLSDRAFLLNVWNHWLELHKHTKQFQLALSDQERINAIGDSILNLEKATALHQLELQFAVAEKEQKLQLAEQEKNLTTLTNYLLWGALLFVLLLFAGIIFFMKRINRRSRQLLETNHELASIQQELTEKKLQEELTRKESQLSAFTLQMVKKHEWIAELTERLSHDEQTTKESLIRTLEKELNKDEEWIDFNRQFEQINSHFYNKLKQLYPEISPYDLKLCALIRLNLSIKEMSVILAITPDSVKTARYRLRKKFRLTSEENLTDFILSLS
ncbi:MAG TPA: tetratricopeptide repeat protein [Fluviicola sp.]|nr:tetratricopeptide repeat protein [Fluviicola sp.]